MFLNFPQFLLLFFLLFALELKFDFSILYKRLSRLSKKERLIYIYIRIYIYISTIVLWQKKNSPQEQEKKKKKKR